MLTICDNVYIIILGKVYQKINKEEILYLQKEIIINDVNVPIIENGGLWYPISYLGNKILLKNLAPSQLRQNGYGKYMKEFKIDYGENTGGILKAYCISEEGLKIILNNSKIGRLSVKQKRQ